MSEFWRTFFNLLLLCGCFGGCAQSLVWFNDLTERRIKSYQPSYNDIYYYQDVEIDSTISDTTETYY